MQNQETRIFFKSPEEKLPVRERLSGNQLGNLISAMGNNEVKALTLAVMRPNTPYSSGELHKALVETQGPYVKWKMGHRVPFEYAQYSLILAGLVNIEDGEIIKTEYGERVGDPAAGLLLDFSSRYPEYALFDFFGGTPSKSRSSEEQEPRSEEFKNRAPVVRKNILWELGTATLPIRVSDAVERLNTEESVIRRHLEELTRKNVIQFEQGHANYKPAVKYMATDKAFAEKPPMYMRYRTDTQLISDILQANSSRSWTLPDILEEYSRINRKTNMTVVSGILSHLTKNGFAQREKFSNEVKSEINLSPEQRYMINDLLTVLDGIQNQNPEMMRYGKERLTHFLSHPEETSVLFEKAREHSSSARNTSEQGNADLIKQILNNNQYMSARDVQKKLQDAGVSFPLTYISTILRNLRSDPQVNHEVKNGINVYTLFEATKTD